MSDRHIHWTEDEEKLERFVLDRVEPAERNELEVHLRTCEICQQTVRNERQLMAEIRRVGRKDMKDRLNSRLSASAGQEIPWPRVLSLAALFLIVLSVGVFNGWFGSQQRELQTLSDETTVMSAPAAPGQNEPVEKSVTQPQDIGKDIARQDAPALSRTAPGTEYRTKESDAASADGRKAMVDKMLRDEHAGKEEGEYSILGADKNKSEQGLRAQEGFAASLQEVWVTGNVLAPASEPAAGTISLEQDAQESGKMKSLSKKDARQQGAVSGTQIFNGQSVALSQQPAGALPLAQQNERRRQTIETQVQSYNQTLHLTLYLDSLVDDEALRTAFVQQVSQDSLVVNIANQRIGYRIPANLNTQTRTR